MERKRCWGGSGSLPDTIHCLLKQTPQCQTTITMPHYHQYTPVPQHHFTLNHYCHNTTMHYLNNTTIHHCHNTAIHHLNITTTPLLPQHHYIYITAIPSHNTTTTPIQMTKAHHMQQLQHPIVRTITPSYHNVAAVPHRSTIQFHLVHTIATSIAVINKLTSQRQQLTATRQVATHPSHPWNTCHYLNTAPASVTHRSHQHKH